MATGNGENQRRGISAHVVWLLVLVICSMLQYIISWWVLKFGTDDAVVSHVGFGGTIVSIILAVLAIVYSYYQTFAQQRDSTTVSTQIEVLRDTVTQMQASEQGLSAGIERFTEISLKLDRTITLGEQSSSAMEKIRGDFKEFQQQATAKVLGLPTTSARPSSSLIDKVAVANALTTTADYIQLSIYLAVILGTEKGLTVFEVSTRIVREAYLEATKYPTLRYWMEGQCMMAAHMLLDLSVARNKDGKLHNILPEFRDAVLNRAISPPTASDNQPLITVESVRTAASAIPNTP